VGIDIEHQYGNGIGFMYSLLDKENIPLEIEPIIMELIEFYESNKTHLQKGNSSMGRVTDILANKIKENIESNRAIYEDYLQDEIHVPFPIGRKISLLLNGDKH